MPTHNFTYLTLTPRKASAVSAGVFLCDTYMHRVWDTQGVPCVYTKAMLAKKNEYPQLRNLAIGRHDAKCEAFLC